MISLTNKEKKWTTFFLLPFYFIFGQYLFSFIFLLVIELFDLAIPVTQLDAWFNYIYMFCLSIIAIVIYQSYLKESLQKIKSSWLKQLFYACTMGYIQFYLVNILSSLMIVFINPESTSTNQDAIMQLAGVAPHIMLVTTVLIAPFLEEMIFRVGIFQYLYDKSRFLAYAVSSLAFGFVHISAGLFGGDLSQLLYLFPYGLLGFVLCRIYEKRDSIFVPMMIHALNNLVAMLMII